MNVYNIVVLVASLILLFIALHFDLKVENDATHYSLGRDHLFVTKSPFLSPAIVRNDSVYVYALFNQSQCEKPLSPAIRYFRNNKYRTCILNFESTLLMFSTGVVGSFGLPRTVLNNDDFAELLRERVVDVPKDNGYV